MLIRICSSIVAVITPSITDLINPGALAVAIPIIRLASTVFDCVGPDTLFSYPQHHSASSFAKCCPSLHPSLLEGNGVKGISKPSPKFLWKTPIAHRSTSVSMRHSNLSMKRNVSTTPDDRVWRRSSSRIFPAFRYRECRKFILATACR